MTTEVQITARLNMGSEDSPDVFKEFPHGEQRFISQITRRNILFIAVMKVLWKGVYFRVIRGIIVAMDQPPFGSLFPVKGVFSCFTEPDVHVRLIIEMEA